MVCEESFVSDDRTPHPHRSCHSLLMLLSINALVNKAKTSTETEKAFVAHGGTGKSRLCCFVNIGEVEMIFDIPHTNFLTMQTSLSVSHLSLSWGLDQEACITSIYWCGLSVLSCNLMQIAWATGRQPVGVFQNVDKFPGNWDITISPAVLRRNGAAPFVTEYRSYFQQSCFEFLATNNDCIVRSAS